MGFIKIVDGEYTHIKGDNYNSLNESPFPRVVAKDFDDYFISIDPELRDVINKEFWNLVHKEK